MPRPPRIVAPGRAHHVTQRGNYRQQVFFRDEDCQLYLALLGEFAVPRLQKAFAQAFQRIHSEYARALHLRLHRSGHL